VFPSDLVETTLISSHALLANDRSQQGKYFPLRCSRSQPNEAALPGPSIRFRQSSRYNSLHPPNMPRTQGRSRQSRLVEAIVLRPTDPFGRSGICSVSKSEYTVECTHEMGCCGYSSRFHDCRKLPSALILLKRITFN